MVNLNSLMVLCLVRFASSEDRISVDTVGTITATAGYSISDNRPPTVTSLQTSSSAEFAAADHDTTKDESPLSGETYTRTPGQRLNSQSLALRSRQARGKTNTNNNQWQNDGGSVEEKDVAEITTFPFTEHRTNEHLYNVKPQTFAADHQSPTQLSDAKSDGSAEKPVPSITYGKKMQENDDRRPVYNDWSEEAREKPSRSRKKNRHQAEVVHEKRRPQTDKVASSGENKDGWQEVSPNMEIATGYSATVQHHDDSSQEMSGSSESLRTRPIMYHSSDDDGGGSISSIENVAQTEPQNFNHKQVLSKMNHFDFSNAVSPTTHKTPPPPREKRLGYPAGGNVLQQSPAVRFAFGGGGGGGQPFKALAPSSAPPPPPMTVKSAKAEQPTANYHSIVVPVPVSHQTYAAIGGDTVHGHQLAGSTMQQAMMSLPVVHNVFFKTDEHGGGKTMPAIVIPLKPEYLQQLQQQQYLYGMRADAAADSQNAAGHQRPVHVGDAGTRTFHYQQQQQQQQQQQPQQQPQPQPQPQQKPKPSKAKKPFGATKDDRVKQPFGLQQHQFYGVQPPYGAGHAPQHGPHFPYHGGHHAMHAATQQHDAAADDSRYGQPAPFPAVGHSLIVKRPHAYGYAAPAKYVQPVSAEEPAAVVAQQQPNVKQPYRATTYRPGFAYLNGPDDDYPYRPVYKDTMNRNDVLVVRTDRRK